MKRCKRTGMLKDSNQRCKGCACPSESKAADAIDIVLISLVVIFFLVMTMAML